MLGSRRVTRTAEPRTVVIPAAVQAWDLRTYRRTARWHAPLLDFLLPRLSRLADKSLLWSLIAIFLNRFGGRQGRRAGLRGLFALALGSAAGNLVALVARRKRPDIKDVPKLRRLVRLPSSPSFPSRHTTSAFAFAAGASFEKPVLAVPLVPLAAAVGYSRVYTGVHYPSDVIAGAALGAGLALVTRRLWPVPPQEPPRARPEAVDLDERPEADGTGLTIVVNPGAGPGKESSVANEIRKGLPGAEVIEVSDDLPIDVALEKAAVSGRAIGIAGGDGSVNKAAHFAHKSGKPLVVFPAGTLNHFAHDLGIEVMDDAVEAVRKGEAVSVDVGVIADRPFLNTASIGSYVDLVDAREKLEGRIGKWPAVAVALFKVLRRAEPVHIEINGESRRIWMAFIGNCRYNPPGFTPSWRDRLDDGTIDVRLMDAHHPFARVRLLWSALTGTLSDCSAYSCDLVSEPLHVKARTGPFRLARDGETFTAPEEFTIRKADERLVLLVPKRDEEVTLAASSAR
jgi:diacylglycerol kinase family enzyme/membrane-associated phospholipid phosphatase